MRHPVEVINFASEEATMSGGTFGSRAMTGTLDTEADIHKAAWDGQPVADHLRAAGLDPTALKRASRTQGSLAAYLELHIEQGGSLESAQIAIGVVEGIVGIRRYEIVFQGYANHAGITRLDVLDGWDTIRVCVGYKIDGRQTDRFPIDSQLLGQSEPVYEEIPGWDGSTAGITRQEQLPEGAKRYVNRLEELLGIPAVMISTGPWRAESLKLSTLLK